MAMPRMFFPATGLFNATNPNISTSMVFRCPSTWYVTASHFPMTRNVEKFTATAMAHVSAATKTTGALYS